MPTYYLSTCLEKIVSIVKTGKLTPKLPHGVNTHHLTCYKNVSDCFPKDITLLHQVFVLELHLPENKSSANTSITLTSINIDSIQQIIVYSLRGSNLVKQLFKNNCPKPIVINAAIFPSSSDQSLKRSLPTLFQVPVENFTRDTKKARTQPPKSSSIISEQKDSEKSDNNEVHIERISTYEEHFELLQAAFTKANKSILITSYSINHETLQEAGLYKLIRSAAARGVSMYFYYNDNKIIDSRIVNFLKKNKIYFADTYTHSKIVAVDNNFVAAGSFNWLSTINKDYEPSDEGSLYIQGETICSNLIEEFWKHIKHYRNEQYGNAKSFYRFESNDYNKLTLTCELDDKTEVSYIPSLEEHCGFLRECLERAQRRVIICSPFISSTRAYELDLDYKLLRNTISRGVDIYFICSNDSASLTDFSWFLSRLNSTQIHLIPLKNLHLKTIVVDEDTLAEGSFNWLSAARERDSSYHNHEQTMVIEGNGAKELISHFFKSRIGKAVLDNICGNMNEKVISLSYTYK